MMHSKITWLAILLFMVCTLHAQPPRDTFYLIKPARVFDGEQLHEGWQVLVINNRIVAAGPRLSTGAGEVTELDCPGCTLLPGLIEGHSHLLLHPYNETKWDEQVLAESDAERVARATVHARNTLLAGFTTVRDLGTEGAGYADVGLKAAIEKSVIPGPRMLVVTRAIVATGSYGPKDAKAEASLPKGAAEADGTDALIKEVRTQIGKGADWIKIYADYRWSPSNEAAPTFTADELKLVVSVAGSSDRPVAAHASTPEGMRRAILAGVTTIEHGDAGTPEVFALMKEKGVALCPTLAAGEAVAQYKGWRKGIDTAPAGIAAKHQSFRAALQAGVTICMGGDVGVYAHGDNAREHTVFIFVFFMFIVGVYAHGDNARELELMAEYGMKPEAVLRSATSINADVFNLTAMAGRIKPGLLADIILVQGNPAVDIHDIRKIMLVMKNGLIYVNKLMEQ